MLGIIALSFTLISVFTLSGPGPFSCGVVAKASRCKASLPDAPLAWFIRPTILKGPVKHCATGHHTMLLFDRLTDLLQRRGIVNGR